MKTSYLPQTVTASTPEFSPYYDLRSDCACCGKVVFDVWRQLDAFCFPAWCRFQLFDADGECIHSSEPQLLGTDDADFRSVTLPVVHSRFRHFLPTPITRRAWRPEIDFDNLPDQVVNKAVRADIHVRSAVDLPEWAAPSAAQLIECKAGRRIVMSPKPQSTERLYLSLDLQADRLPSVDGDVESATLCESDLQDPAHKNQHVPHLKRPQPVVHQRRMGINLCICDPNPIRLVCCSLCASGP